MVKCQKLLIFLPDILIPLKMLAKRMLSRFSGQARYLIHKTRYVLLGGIIADERKLKVMTVVGTRPEIIRLSEVIKACDRYFNHILVHTGQNWDYTLNRFLRIRYKTTRLLFKRGR